MHVHELGNMDYPVMIEVELRHPDAKMPYKSRASDAGLDITSITDVDIEPRSIVSIDPGLAVVAPFGWYFTVEGRSSMYKSGIVPFRGIIDSCYTGNLIISMMNVGNETYHISKGDRIAQIILHKLNQTQLVEVCGISPEYNIRGTAGFGSSGR